MNESSPIAEVFGFAVNDLSPQAARYRTQKLCPYNNRVPNCTKDKANNPLGVCSINHNKSPVICCPVRFREDWIIIEEAARFFFSGQLHWTSLSEVRLNDALGKSAGNIDYVLAAVDSNGKLVDFAALEVQAVYITGNLRDPFESYLNEPKENFSWVRNQNYPKPDFLSSSRKRLVPQLLYKGGILKSWRKKQAVALQKIFFGTLPELPQVEAHEADIVWLILDLEFETTGNQSKYRLKLVDRIYTAFVPAMERIIVPTPGDLKDFEQTLQSRLDAQISNAPESLIWGETPLI